ncbi:MAG: histidine--tRNA ligase [Candidatus Melainabacteria bacterium]|nr:histidine--tRNA ligase [Candidatus Melainabacteria bacterium]
MHLSTQPYKGTRDFYPEDMRIQEWMFETMSQVARSYGYQSYNGPMLEPFELYAAKTGEEIVNQQLYWMMDRGERKIAVRPEMTPTLARMVAGKIHELPKPVRWYSIPNLWRYERPQRGRLREHWQLNVDVLGGDSILADAEILTLAYSIIQAFGGEKQVQIKVNNRRLLDYFFIHVLGLSADVALKTTKALDARAKIGEEAYAKWLTDLGISESIRGKMETFFHSSFEQTAREYPCEGVKELQALFQYLEASGIHLGKTVVYDPLVLRGFDYYTGTVFEMYDTSPENRRAMFGGGRYDNLVGLFGNHKLSGVGFGWGDVTLRNFLETHKLLPEFPPYVDVLVTLPKLDLMPKAQAISADLRAKGFRVITPLSCDGFGNQLKVASKHSAALAILLGDAELQEGKVVVKDLREGQQETVLIEKISDFVSKKLKSRI